MRGKECGTKNLLQNSYFFYIHDYSLDYICISVGVQVNTLTRNSNSGMFICKLIKSLNAKWQRAKLLFLFLQIKIE